MKKYAIHDYQVQKHEKLPVEDKKIWVEALRSGKYKQGKEWLEDEGCHCCLGVYAKVKGAQEIVGEELITDDIGSTINAPDCLLDSSFLSLKLAQSNDAGMTFEEIADWIEENL